MTGQLQTADAAEYDAVLDFYRLVTERMQGRSNSGGWKWGVYPALSFLKESLDRGELYVMREENGYLAAVILNSSANEGYEGLPWKADCSPEEVLIPHALAVRPDRWNQGVGRLVAQDVLRIAREQRKKAVRLDVLGTNLAARRLYPSVGFTFVQSKALYYEDTGLTEYLMYEYVL